MEQIKSKKGIKQIIAIFAAMILMAGMIVFLAGCGSYKPMEFSDITESRAATAPSGYKAVSAQGISAYIPESLEYTPGPDLYADNDRMYMAMSTPGGVDLSIIANNEEVLKNYVADEGADIKAVTLIKLRGEDLLIIEFKAEGIKTFMFMASDGNSMKVAVLAFRKSVDQTIVNTVVNSLVFTF